ncbi:MAG: galactokinase [Lachnospiraceae bacterium]|nr:galactokinase [Lachnospiraceae bacterium]
MKSSDLKERLKNGSLTERLEKIYIDNRVIKHQTQRYITAIEKFEEIYGETDIEIYSAPGRSEVCGNHTDHQHGEILAASINLDALAVVSLSDENIIRVVSDGYDEICLSTDDIEKKPEEEGTTAALIRGVMAGVLSRGYKLGGFKAYVTSEVLIGAGLSSSAAFETLIGTVISYMFNDGVIDAVTIAIIGQYAENVYFGKPCGLMDQMACSVGNLVHVDFSDTMDPEVEKIDFDLNHHGYSLCITDTKGSHADLTDEYAAIPYEMKQVANLFGREYLTGLTLKDLYSSMDMIREKCGDRAVLRAIHLITENERVKRCVGCMKQDDIRGFLRCIKESGDSSYKYLQNVYCSSDVTHQNVSLAPSVSEQLLLDDGVCRVHGGGFAGTIQAFVKDDAVDRYLDGMDRIFGKGSCRVLKIRSFGGIKCF